MVEAIDICVMLGGPSPEREVSLRSGAAVAGALREAGHRVVEVDPADGTFQLPPNVDVVFLALHGTYGEDGTVQSELDAIGVPYTGCGAAVSRLAFDKVQTKRACAGHGLSLANDVVINLGVITAGALVAWTGSNYPDLIIGTIAGGICLLYTSDAADE